MKQSKIILSMIVLLSSIFIIGCGKDETHPEESEIYEYSKSKVQIFENGEMTSEIWAPEPANKSLIHFKENNLIEYSYMNSATEEVEKIPGSFDAKEKTLCLKDDCSTYYFEDNFLVLLIIDTSGDEGIGNKIFAYYKKK